MFKSRLRVSTGIFSVLLTVALLSVLGLSSALALVDAETHNYDVGAPKV